MARTTLIAALFVALVVGTLASEFESPEIAHLTSSNYDDKVVYCLKPEGSYVVVTSVSARSQCGLPASSMSGSPLAAHQRIWVLHCLSLNPSEEPQKRLRKARALIRRLSKSRCGDKTRFYVHRNMSLHSIVVLPRRSAMARSTSSSTTPPGAVSPCKSLFFIVPWPLSVENLLDPARGRMQALPGPGCLQM